MDEKKQLQQALATLQNFIYSLAVQAEKDQTYADTLWQAISQSEGLLQELAYYHDYGTPLCKYQVAGYTLADILIWQVDHFKLYMDRPDEMNRYRQPRLILSAFETMAQMEKSPDAFTNKMRYETGQDIIV